MPFKGLLNNSEINTIILDSNHTKLKYKSADASDTAECEIDSRNSESNNTFTLVGEGSENYELDMSTLPKIYSKIHKRPLAACMYNVVKEYDGTDYIPRESVAWELLPTDAENSGIVEGTSVSAQDGGFSQLVSIEVINGGEGYEEGDTFAVTLRQKVYQQRVQTELNPETANSLIIKVNKVNNAGCIESIQFVPNNNNAFTLDANYKDIESGEQTLVVTDPRNIPAMDSPKPLSTVFPRNVRYQPDIIPNSNWSLIPQFTRNSTGTDPTTTQNPGGAVFRFNFRLHPNKSSIDIPEYVASDRGLVYAEFEPVDYDVAFPSKNVTQTLVPLKYEMPQLSGPRSENYKLSYFCGYGIITPKIIHSLEFYPNPKVYDGTHNVNCSIHTDDIVPNDDVEFSINSDIVHQTSPASSDLTIDYLNDDWFATIEYFKLFRAIQISGADKDNYKIIRPHISFRNLQLMPRPITVTIHKIVFDASKRGAYHIVYDIHNVIDGDDVNYNVYSGANKIFNSAGDGASIDALVPEIYYENGKAAGVYFNNMSGIGPSFSIAVNERGYFQFTSDTSEKLLEFDDTKCLYSADELYGYRQAIQIEIINVF